MDIALKIVTQTPPTELWNGNGLLDAHRAENLEEADIVRLLQNGSSLVVAEAGQPLQWISEGDRFRVLDDRSKVSAGSSKCRWFYFDHYPDNYCYVASMWQCAPATPVIVLEKASLI